MATWEQIICRTLLYGGNNDFMGEIITFINDGDVIGTYLSIYSK